MTPLSCLLSELPEPWVMLSLRGIRIHSTASRAKNVTLATNWTTPNGFSLFVRTLCPVFSLVKHFMYTYTSNFLSLWLPQPGVRVPLHREPNVSAPLFLPVKDYETIVNLIVARSTAKGLGISCRLNRRHYSLGKKISDEEFSSINLVPDDFHGEWN